MIKDNITTMIQKNVLSPVKTEEEHQFTRPPVAGSLIYLVKNSRPDLNNSVRELSNRMDSEYQEG